MVIRVKSGDHEIVLQKQASVGYPTNSELIELVKAAIDGIIKLKTA